MESILDTRRIVGLCLLLAGFVVYAPAVSAQDPSEIHATVRRILRETPLIDGHNDTPWQYRLRASNHLERIDFRDTTTLDSPMHTDIPRLRAGGVGAQFWSVYVPATYRGADGIKAVVEQIDFTHRLVRKYSDVFEMAYTTDDIVRIHAEGKIASLMGMEGGHSIGNSLGALRMLYTLGARYMTLTHSLNTDWADSATDDPAVGGLTAFGEEVVHEMNRLGMMVDLSHVAPQTMHDALDVTEAPIIYSHSSARAVCDHPRNVPDDVLRRIPDTDGVVMVTFLSHYVDNDFSQYVSRLREQMVMLRARYRNDEPRIRREIDQWREAHPAPPNPTIPDLADHFDHIRQTIGIDYLGIGSDYDGTTNLVGGMEDVSCFPRLLAELMRRGYTESDIKKIAGGNLLRVFRKVEQVAARLQRERAPSDVQIDEVQQLPAESDLTSAGL